MEKEKRTLKPSFSSLVMSIASVAILKMGLDPKSKEEKDMNLARFNIDLLSLLEEKTKNNLEEKETELLKSCVKDLQMQFIQIENSQKK